MRADTSTRPCPPPTKNSLAVSRPAFTGSIVESTVVAAEESHEAGMEQDPRFEAHRGDDLDRLPKGVLIDGRRLSEVGDVLKARAKAWPRPR